MKLFFQKYGTGPPLFILHGFLGMSDNWLSPGKKLSSYFTVYLIDSRNHGRSPHTDAFGYEEMTADLLELIRDEGIESLSLMGHSMGGKLAMRLTLDYPEMVSKLIVADISPAVTAGDPVQQHLIKTTQGLDPGQFSSYDAINNALNKEIPDERLRGFILKNIRRDPDVGFNWKPNIRILFSEMHKLRLGIHPGKTFGGPVLFIKGEKSPYLSTEDLPRIFSLFPNAQYKEIKGAGHWLHAEKPEEFLGLVKGFLKANDDPL